MLKLYGVVSKIYDNSILIGGHYDSMDKLKRVRHPGKSPVLNNKFFVNFKEEAGFSPDIAGEKVMVRAKPVPYKFHSTYEKNKGELIQGWKLHLVDITKDSDWS